MSRQDRLDEVLEQWTQRHAPAASELERLTQQISAALAEGKPLAAPGETQARPRAGARARMAGALALTGTLAAGLLLTYLVATAPRRRGAKAPKDVPPTPFAMARFQQGQLAGKARLLAEAQRLFGGQLAWLAEADSQVQMGLTDDGPVSGPAVAVRLVLLRRHDPTQPWTCAWSTDVIARAQEVVQWANPPDGPSRLSLWAYVLPDGLIAIDTAFELPGRAAVWSAASGLQAEGVPTLAHAVHDQGIEYQMLQTVAVVNEKVG
jgi:hypothetical protein